MEEWHRNCNINGKLTIVDTGPRKRAKLNCGSLDWMSGILKLKPKLNQHGLGSVLASILFISPVTLLVVPRHSADTGSVPAP